MAGTKLAERIRAVHVVLPTVKFRLLRQEGFLCSFGGFRIGKNVLLRAGGFSARRRDGDPSNTLSVVPTDAQSAAVPTMMTSTEEGACSEGVISFEGSVAHARTWLRESREVATQVRMQCRGRTDR